MEYATLTEEHLPGGLRLCEGGGVTVASGWRVVCAVLNVVDRLFPGKARARTIGGVIAVKASCELCGLDAAGERDLRRSEPLGIVRHDQGNNAEVPLHHRDAVALCRQHLREFDACPAVLTVAIVTRRIGRQKG